MKKIQGIGLITGLLMIIVTSVMMWDRPLWGYIPLFNYLGFWLVVVFSMMGRMAKAHDARRRLILAIGSGILLSLGFPVNYTFILLAIGFVPLMIIERELLALYGKPKLWLLWFHLFVAFWLWNILSTFWVANTAYIAGMIANVINAALMTLPFLVFHLISYRTTQWWRYALLAGLWIMFEYLHTSWEMSWPWLTLGNGLATAYPLAQWYEYTGYFGGSVWFWLLNILCFHVYYGKAKRKIASISVTLSVLLVPMVISLTMYYRHKPRGVPVDITIIQPNFEPHYKKFSIPEQVQVNKIMAMTEANIDSATRLIVMPETVFDPINLDEVYQLNPSLQQMHRLFDKSPQAHILAGVGGYHIYKQDPGRLTVRQQGNMYYEMYNAALMLQKDSLKVQEYYKSKFVPGAEIFPFKKVLFFLRPLIRKLGGTYEGFAPQAEPTNLKAGELNIAAIICYESVYGGWVTGYVRAGAGLLAIITNDGWWDNTPGHLQHLQIGRLRAIENRKEVLRSANTGISCIINQRGDIRFPTAYEEDATIRSKALYDESKTFYSRHGDYIIGFVGAITFVLMCAGLYITFRKEA